MLNRIGSQGLPYLLSLAPITVFFISHLTQLETYPTPYGDESFYTAPAVSYLDHQGFVHQTDPAAPYGDRVWAYHGPFYPWVAVPSFAAFGVSHWAGRLPQFLAANLGVALLCCSLIRRGFPLTSIIVAIVWVGDRSFEEVMYARMEGLYLFCLILGFLCLDGARGTWRWLASGFCLSAACGFHPVALFFPIAGAYWVWRQGRAKALAAYAVGGLLTAALVLACWWPDPIGAVNQFLWHARLFTSLKDRHVAWMELAHTLRWSRFWAWATFLCGGVLAVGLLARLVLRVSIRSFDSETVCVAALFSGAGVLGLAVLAKFAFPYYLVLYTLWPVVGVAAAIESKAPRHLAERVVIYALAFLLVAGWIPSLCWNSMRLREAVLLSRNRNTAPLVDAIRAATPADAWILGGRQFFAVGRYTERRFCLLPWHAKSQVPPGDAWILVSEEELNSQEQLAQSAIQSRPVVLRTNFFPAGVPGNFAVVLLGPVGKN